MENNVTLSIRSVQTLPEGGEERMEQTAPGRLTREGEAWLLTYREGEDSGLGSTRTTLRLTPGKLVLRREGEITSQMIFREGRPHSSLYETPYGRLPLTVRTLTLAHGLTGQGGSIRIHYHMELGGAPAGETRLEITVREREKIS